MTKSDFAMRIHEQLGIPLKDSEKISSTLEELVLLVQKKRANREQKPAEGNA